MSQKNTILTPFHHRLLKMRLLEGLLVEEIANKVNLSLEGVYYHFKRIHKILKTDGLISQLYPSYIKYLGSENLLIEIGLNPVLVSRPRTSQKSRRRRN